jgi:carboxypeptidase Taq
VPADLVERITAATQVCLQDWSRARAAADWTVVLPGFETVVALARERAALISRGAEPYDACLDDWDAGSTADAVRAALDPLRRPLTRLNLRLADVGTASGDEARFASMRRVPRGEQRRLGAMLARAFGFDPARGTMGETEHPFTILCGPGDVRFAVEYREDDVFWGLGSVHHEMGHWLYSDGIAPKLYGTPLHDSASFVCDEGVARYWQSIVCNGRPYLEWLAPRLPNGWTADDAFRHVNAVNASRLRLGAADASYDLHILLRLDIEQSLINGSLLPREVPDAWNALSRELLGFTPKDDAEGVLQDDHWFAGFFGYFPTYALGNLFAAQLDAAVRRDVADVDGLLSRGEFGPITDWLKERLFSHGATYGTAETIRLATGRPLDPGHHLARLDRLYGELYGV